MLHLNILTKILINVKNFIPENKIKKSSGSIHANSRYIISYILIAYTISGPFRPVPGQSPDHIVSSSLSLSLSLSSLCLSLTRTVITSTYTICIYMCSALLVNIFGQDPVSPWLT